MASSAQCMYVIVRCCTVAGFLTGFAALCTQTAWADDDNHRHHRRTCLIVDTDVATDDFRAFAVLFPHRELRAVVVTEGISSVAKGSTAIALFLASGQSTAPVIPGLASALPPTYDWLPLTRAVAERLNGLLPQSIPSAADSNKLRLALAAALKGCNRVEVLVLGPWSSFVQYSAMLRPFIRRVVASGRPFSETNPDNFNCEYDRAACEKAEEFLNKVRRAVWVDLPTGNSYPATLPFITQLGEIGMPGLLRAALDANHDWSGTRFWDDSAALYLLAPELFKATQGQTHLEPAIDEEALSNALINAINAPPQH